MRRKPRRGGSTPLVVRSAKAGFVELARCPCQQRKKQPQESEIESDEQALETENNGSANQGVKTKVGRKNLETLRFFFEWRRLKALNQN